MFKPNFRYTNVIVNNLVGISSAREVILNLHKDITQDTLDNPDWEGKYRKIQVYVGNRITGEVIFIPPPPEEVPVLMENLIEWLNSEEAFELHPVIVAGISHYELVRIHPFGDGNGRTARALATLILYMREFDIKRFFALTDRQMRIIESIQKNGRITSGEIQRMFKITRQAAYKEIKKLKELDIIEQKGSGKGIFYILR